MSSPVSKSGKAHGEHHHKSSKIHHKKGHKKHKSPKAVKSSHKRGHSTSTGKLRGRRVKKAEDDYQSASLGAVELNPAPEDEYHSVSFGAFEASRLSIGRNRSVTMSSQTSYARSPSDPQITPAQSSPRSPRVFDWLSPRSSDNSPRVRRGSASRRLPIYQIPVHVPTHEPTEEEEQQQKQLKEVDLLVGGGQYAKALEELKKVLCKAKKAPDLIHRLQEIARKSFVDDTDLATTIESCKLLWSYGKRIEEMKAIHVKALYKTGRWKEALEIDPNHIPSQVEKAKAYAEDAKFSDAYITLKFIPPQQRDDTILHEFIKLGRDACYKGELTIARDCVRLAASQNPDLYAQEREYVKRELIKAFFDQGKYDDVLELEPYHLETLRALVDQHMKREEFSIAFERLKQEYRHTTSKDQVLSHFAILGERCYSRATREGYEGAAVFFGFLFDEGQASEQTKAKFKKVLWELEDDARLELVDPNYPPLLLKKGNCYLEDKNYEEALPCLQKAWSREQDELKRSQILQAIETLAEDAYELRIDALVVKACVFLIENGNNTEQVRAWLTAAYCALQQYDNALAVDPQHGPTLKARALKYKREGKYTKSFADLKGFVEAGIETSAEGAEEMVRLREACPGTALAEQCLQFLAKHTQLLSDDSKRVLIQELRAARRDDEAKAFDADGYLKQVEEAAQALKDDNPRAAYDVYVKAGLSQVFPKIEELGKLCVGRRQAEVALLCFNHLYEQKQNLEGVLALLIRDYDKLSAFYKLDYLNFVLKVQPNHIEALKLRADWYVDREASEQEVESHLSSRSERSLQYVHLALGDFEKLRELTPEDMTFLTQMVQLYVKVRKEREALFLCSEILDKDSRNFFAQTVMEELFQHSETIDAIKAGILRIYTFSVDDLIGNIGHQDRPHVFAVLMQLGDIYSSNKQKLKLASACYKLAKSLGAKTLALEIKLARLAFRRRRYDKAIARCDKILKEDAYCSAAYQIRGDAYCAKSEWKLGARDYRQFILCADDKIDAFSWFIAKIKADERKIVSRLLEMPKDAEELQKSVQKLFSCNLEHFDDELIPQYLSNIFVNLYGFYQEEDFEVASKCIELALRVHPENKTALNYLTEIAEAKLERANEATTPGRKQQGQ